MARTEPSRTREHGTHVTQATTPQERIAAFRAIVAERQYAKIDGVMIDLTTASIVVQVYDALNDANKAKFAGADAAKMAIIAYRLAG